MKARKLKSEIISDYIKILSANNFCEFCIYSLKLYPQEFEEILSCREYATCLLQTYKKLMFKLGLINLSLAVLDKQMLIDFCSYNESTLDKNEVLAKFHEIENKIKKIGKGLKIKLKKLELNSFELNYLKVDKLASFADYYQG